VRRDLRKFVVGMSRRVTLDAAAALPGFNGRALIVWSANDRFFPVALGERLHRAIRNSRLLVIDNARTLLPEDHPDELAGCIDRFMREADAERAAS
jgi:pimeloyl-ACP methyl ester carboxylesterase